MDLTYGQNWGESECKQDFGGETYEVIRARRIWKKDITGGCGMRSECCRNWIRSVFDGSL